MRSRARVGCATFFLVFLMGMSSSVAFWTKPAQVKEAEEAPDFFASGAAVAAGFGAALAAVVVDVVVGSTFRFLGAGVSCAFLPLFCAH